MPFSSIIGHDRPVGILKRTLANGSLAHAYVFAGDEGIGKLMTARAFAEAVNCEAPGPEGGCGTCASCRKAAARTHPDILEIRSESEDEQLLAQMSKREAEKASDRIKIDQVRQAQERLSLKAHEGRKKVLIIDGAHAMTEEAMNAFLKTLEEPPGDSLIILVTSMPHRLLATIHSRCQRIAFQPLPRRACARVLRERRGLSEDDAWFLAALSQGSLGRALAMDVDAEKKVREELFAVLDGLVRMPRDEVQAMAEGIARDRDGFERLLAIGIERLRDHIVLRETGEERLLVYTAAADRGGGGLSGVPLQRVLRDLDLLTSSRQMLERRISPQLIAERLFLSLGRA